MADTKELANKARTTLSQALSALQADDVPEALLDVAEPIAKSMGVLHKVEKGTGGTIEEVDQALENVRKALDQLQQVGVDHSAAEAAMEAVAGSLSKMFALSKALKADAPTKPDHNAEAKAEPKPEKPRAEAKPEPKAEKPRAEAKEKEKEEVRGPGGTVRIAADDKPAEVEQLKQQLREQREARQAQQAQQAQPQSASPSPLQTQRQAQPHQTAQALADAQMQAQQAQVQAQAQAQMQAQAQAQPPQQPRAEARKPEAGPSRDKQRVPGMTDAPLPPEGAKRFDVELGAHSSSNFYKGLSGNDVIDHGGIFVATYQVPKVGMAVALRVHLPGDLEFDGDAIVQWTRDVRSGESDPGFGARFTRISAEGRQLVYRYVRNREPMFYDDL